MAATHQIVHVAVNHVICYFMQLEINYIKLFITTKFLIGNLIK